MKKRIILFNAVIVIIGFLAAFTVATLLIQNQYQKEFTKRLDAVLTVLTTEADKFEASPEQYANLVEKELHKAGQQMRISIISLNGKVLGDSEPESIEQNHLERPEIKQALKNGRGYDIRLSTSVNKQFYYEAVYVKDQFFIRAALPTEDLHAAIKNLWFYAIISMLFGIAMVCVLTGILAHRVSEPLKKLTITAKEIAEGDYSSRVEGNYRDEVGELARSFNQMADHTEQTMAELTEKQSQLEGVLQGMDDGVLAVNEKNQILFLNQSARMLLNNLALSEGKLLEGSMLISKIANLMQKVMVKQLAVKETITANTQNSERQFTVYSAQIEGQPTNAALAVITDVTRVRKLEKLRSEFVANVTHELKTPLTSIRSSIELLKSANRDEETRNYFYDVLDIEAERLNHLIDDMLVLSQIENAKEDPSVCPCNVKQALNGTLERFADKAEKCGVTLTINSEENLIVSCSPTRLQQLFGNLIENAIKYNKPNGEVTVTAQKQRRLAVIRVKDNGIGIEKEHLNRLFERFYRVDTSRSREVGGTGLGLSIVKHLTTLYNGDVSVESTPGVGTTFTVRLPLSEGDGVATKE